MVHKIKLMTRLSRGNWLTGQGFWGIGVFAFKGYRAVTGTWVVI